MPEVLDQPKASCVAPKANKQAASALETTDALIGVPFPEKQLCW
jgi:hypothetical protein